MTSIKSKLILNDDDFSDIYSFNNNPILSINKEIHTITIYSQNLIEISTQKTINQINSILSDYFTNAFCHIIYDKPILWFKLNPQDDFINLSHEEFFTFQGRSREDYHLKIINLSQNYRWDKSMNQYLY